MLQNEQHVNLEIRALTDAGLREAIGGVCIHWALLELTVERLLSTLEGTPGTLRYESDLGANLQKLDRMIEIHGRLNAGQAKDIRKLIERTRELRKERHRVTHGLWGKDESGVIHSVFPALRRDVPPVKPVVVDDIRQLKLRILTLGKSFRRYVDPLDSVRIQWEKE